MPRSRVFRDAAAVLLVALAYFAGARIGFILTPADSPVAVFWPPNAILLASFLLAPVRLWGWFLVALAPAHFLAQLPLGVPLSTAFGWLIGNAGEALVGAALISRMGRRTAVFHSVRGVTRFLLFGFILAPLVTSFLDAAIVVGTHWGSDYWRLWIMRLLSNMLAQVTIVPAIVVFGQRAAAWRISEPRPRAWFEAAALGVSVVLVGLFVFRAAPLSRTSIPALIYVPLPLLLWAAMRFGPGGLSASLMTIAVISVQNLMNGRGPFISTSPAESVLSMQVFLCTIGVPLLLLAANTLEQRLTERSLRLTSRKVIDAQERERQQIAQELHDDVAGTLTLAEIELDRMIAGERPQPSPAALNKVRDQLTAISQAIWELSHGLYPSNLEYLGLVHSLKRMCADLADETQIELDCETTDIPERLPPDVSLCLYRVAQEALKNVVRHSHAKHASVRLLGNHQRLLLQIDDDGVGFNQSGVVSGLGFSSMRERLKAVHGGVHIESAPNQGTRLEAWVMLRSVS